jgi:hypothetical protein
MEVPWQASQDAFTAKNNLQMLNQEPLAAVNMSSRPPPSDA